MSKQREEREIGETYVERSEDRIVGFAKMRAFFDMIKSVLLILFVYQY